MTEKSSGLELLRLANRATVDGQPIEFLSSCTPRDWERLLAHCSPREFSAGQVMVAAGDYDRALLILTSGALELRVDDADGRQRIYERIDAPSLLGEVAFLDGGSRSGTLVALTDGDLLRLEFTAFQSLASAEPALARLLLLEVGRVVALRLRRATRIAAR
jgi:CRP-like cAMP-binding protein